MWFERDLPRLNVLLEMLGDWVSAGNHAQLFALLQRVKWVVDFESCIVTLRPSHMNSAQVFSLRNGSAQEIGESAIPAACAEALTSVGTYRRVPQPIQGRVELLTAPLAVAGEVFGAIAFVARSTELYDASDARFVEAIACYFASAWQRIAVRAREQRQTLENQRKDEFLALLGHELRNPLAPMLTALELMKNDITRVRERAILERQVRHLARLVDDLMDVARVTRGKLNVAMRPVELADVVSRAIELASPALELHGHHLSVDADRRLIVQGDVDRLAQIVSNLLTNAAKFSMPSGRIAISTFLVGECVRVSVSDQGVGIAPVDLERVFEPFTQLGSRGLDRAGGGLGLGLPLARNLALAHGGELFARSEGLGRGATFTLELPRSAVHELLPLASPEAGAADHEADPAHRRVLLVDDNEDAAELLESALRGAGFAVCVAHDGPSALAAASRFEPDFCVLDIGLPGMDGYELAASLREDPKHAQARLIAVTGYGQASDVEKAREVGFDEHFVKPVDLARLRQALHH